VPSIDNASSRDRDKMITLAFNEIIAGADGDVIEAAHALTRWSIRLLDVGGAGVMMADDRGVLRSVVVSSETVRALEAAELDRGRGPCVESHRRAFSVIHADHEVVDPRWPEFGSQLRAGGMRAAHAIPVLGAGTALGVLNLFRTSTGGLTDSEADLAHSLADAAGAAVSPRPSPARMPVRAEDLAGAVADAAIVERAKGMLSVRLQVGIDTTHAVLRRVAKDRGLTVGEVATAVVTGRTTVTLPLSVGTVTD
jgi:hypothetical protein